jgi:type II secretory pathway pseudopilin PulG
MSLISNQQQHDELMKTYPTRTKHLNKKFSNSGMTLIEISLVIALLLGLIAVVFMGIGSYRKGADQATCRIRLAQVQKAVRAHSNFQNLAIGAAFAQADAFGVGKAMENAPVCPSGGVYTWLANIPAINTPYGNCNYAGDGPSNTHVLTPANTTDW